VLLSVGVVVVVSVGGVGGVTLWESDPVGGGLGVVTPLVRDGSVSRVLVDSPAVVVVTVRLPSGPMVTSEVGAAEESEVVGSVLLSIVESVVGTVPSGTTWCELGLVFPPPPLPAGAPAEVTSCAIPPNAVARTTPLTASRR
jgi:hypothetical protein